MNAKRVVSGIRPTGKVHLGNYLGAIRNAVALQDAYRSFYFIADLHAITDSLNAKLLAEHTYSTAAIYLACGIDPSRATLFVQSQVAAHAQLARLLGAITPVGVLKRMIQFKEKASANEQEAGLGLLEYPVLMAADILLYQADLVPVGDDQRQHLELSRDLAGKFNRMFSSQSKPVFTVPEALVVPSAGRVMSLTDGKRKMSKSDSNDCSRINLLDSADTIRAKVRRARTDATLGLEFDNPERPEAGNLLTIYQQLSGKSRQQVAEQCREMSYGEFKPLLAETIISALAPIRERYDAISRDRAHLQSLLKQGRQQAEAVAEETLNRALAAMGFAQPV